MARARTRIPKYRLHRPSGRAVVTLNGRDIYLGKHGTKQSKEAYDRAVNEWLANGRELPGRLTRDGLTVKELILRYWKFCKTYYVKNGKATNEQGCIKSALRPVRQLYGSTPAAEFGPLALKACRQALIDRGLCRYSVNQHAGRIKRMFAWAVEQELLPGSVHHALQAVKGLKKFRTTAPERPKVQPAPLDDVLAVLPHVPKPVAARPAARRAPAADPIQGMVFLCKPSGQRPDPEPGPVGLRSSTLRGRSR